MRALSPYTKAAHLAVAHMVANTLTLADDKGLRAFWGLCLVLRKKLSSSERQGLAWAALMACNDDEAQSIAEAVLTPELGIGWPLPPFDGVLEEAVFWADFASQEELRAYAFSCLDRLSAEERRAIWRALDRQVAA
ncbi:hypothetical protein FHG66_11220 [Rubellimicrobium rubrum]|uniref:Uncharacterized protein n=1 Tax=Rubellimicrobium rubrum TaxID=2585369 RepID=A0A5C4MTT3_9RHOB|nr:hypothetical protein [Rubellimicrobium rubrum]TNC49304.1 hypothetical protein FHG66_11220 [Rubellimicrobium rubrum]